MSVSEVLVDVAELKCVVLRRSFNAKEETAPTTTDTTTMNTKARINEAPRSLRSRVPDFPRLGFSALGESPERVARLTDSLLRRREEPRLLASWPARRTHR